MAFMASTNDLSSGTGGQETPRVLITNPVDSGAKMRIFTITCGTNVSTNNNIFRFYRGPTVTANGNLLTPVNNYVRSGAVQSLMKIYTNPTVSASGQLFLNWIAGPTSTQPINFQSKLILAPGESILIGVRPNTTGVTWSCNVFWIEN